MQENRTLAYLVRLEPAFVVSGCADSWLVTAAVMVLAVATFNCTYILVH
jgi:hypothetical protein